jgi:hypothetical protein
MCRRRETARRITAAIGSEVVLERNRNREVQASAALRHQETRPLDRVRFH